jgi:hypothetical protein
MFLIQSPRTILAYYSRVIISPHNRRLLFSHTIPAYLEGDGRVLAVSVLCQQWDDGGYCTRILNES